MRPMPRFVAFCSLAGTLAVVQPAAAQSSRLLQVRTGASQDRLVLDSAGGLLVTGDLYKGSTVIPPTGDGARLLYYPRKAALRAGYVASNQWDEGNTGLYSIALGYNASAAGQGSFAAAYGDSVAADATGGVALGYYSTATAYAASAMGHFADATGSSAISLGHQAVASGQYAAALGDNALASATASIALGHYARATGAQSVALGSHVSTAGYTGAIVIGDSYSDTLLASASNQFSARASGGYRLYTNSTATIGVELTASDNSWGIISDRNRKHDFAAVDGEELLGRLRRVPVSTWRFREAADPAVRHIGPMAQDWQAAFGFRADTTTISSGDLDGVNLAGVKALDERTRKQQAQILQQAERIRALETELTEMRALRGEVAELRALLTAERRAGRPERAVE